MICNKCKHLKTINGYDGYKVDRCELRKGITWDRENRVYESAMYCRGE